MTGYKCYIKKGNEFLPCNPYTGEVFDRGTPVPLVEKSRKEELKTWKLNIEKQGLTVKITNASDEKEDSKESFMNEVISEGKFNADQMDEIHKGFEQGLTIEEVKTFAKPEISWQDMQKIRKEMFKPFKMSFSKGFDKNKAIKFIRKTHKPIKYTKGFKYKHPTTYLKPVSNDEAIEIIKKGYLLDIDECADYIDINEFSSNDMW